MEKILQKYILKKKTKNNTFIDLNLDESNNNITFRFIEFLDVEEEKIK